MFKVSVLCQTDFKVIIPIYIYTLINSEGASSCPMPFPLSNIVWCMHLHFNHVGGFTVVSYKF